MRQNPSAALKNRLMVTCAGVASALLLPACFFGVFNNSDVTGEISKQATDPTADACVSSPAHGAPDECFGNDTSKKGLYRLANESSIFDPAHTDTTLPQGAAITTPVTTTDSEGNFYAIYPVLKNNLAAARLIQLKANQTSASLPGSGLIMSPIVSSGGFGGAAHLTVSALKVTDGPSSAIKYIYFAGTYYNTSTSEDEFFVCRLISDSASSSNTPTSDSSFYPGSSNGCANFSSSSMSADLGASTYVPSSARIKPVHIAFHRGIDNVDRIILAGSALKAPATQYVILIPIRLDGTGISGPGGTGLAKITGHDLNTSNSASTFDTFGTSRSVRLSALEGDTASANTDKIFMLLAFRNDAVSVGSGLGATTAIEHLVFRLNSSLSPDASFGAAYTLPSVYIPAVLDGPFSAAGIKALNTRPWSTTENWATMKVHNGAIQILGLHMDTAGSEPSGMGYRLIKFPAAGAGNQPDSYSETTTNTFCSPVASPAFTIKQNTGNILIACTQKANSNSIVREHNASDLGVATLMGSAGTNYASMIENTHIDLQGKFATGITSVWVPEKSMHAVYTFYLEKSGSSHYPVVLKTWSQ